MLFNKDVLEILYLIVFAYTRWWGLKQFRMWDADDVVQQPYSRYYPITCYTMILLYKWCVIYVRFNLIYPSLE